MSSQLLITLTAKPLLAGCLVALISQLSTALRPTMFAGLFAAAPSVATASLVLSALSDPSSVHPGAQGMIAGAVGMIACCVVATLVVPRARALAASALGWLAWGVGGLGLFWAWWR